MRTTITERPFRDPTRPWTTRGHWPCSWVASPTPIKMPFVIAYRQFFSLDTAATIRAHVSADERYILYLDGHLIGRGSERGDIDHWFFETYDLQLEAGEHVIVAQVWSQGEQRHEAQFTVAPGFIFAPEAPFTDMLGTGLSDWEVKELSGFSYINSWPTYRIGPNLRIDGATFDWGFEQGAGDGWQAAVVVEPGVGYPSAWSLRHNHWLRPAPLPPMIEIPITGATVRFVAAIDSLNTLSLQAQEADHLTEEVSDWQALLNSKAPLTVPPHTIRRVIVDLNNYYCAYPEIIASGGAGSTISLEWAESLYTAASPGKVEPNETGEIVGAKHHFIGHCPKANRDEVFGKYFFGVGDIFLPDSGKQRRFATLWWQAGRYLELIVQTADEALQLDSITLFETRYPLENKSSFEANDPRCAQLTPILARGVQVSAHETYTDSPYYEQLAYVADTRNEALVTYVMTRDARLPLKTIRMFDYSREHWGWTQARYPCWVRQYIPAWALWWVGMVYDYALWRGDAAFLEEMMPGVRATIDGTRCFYNSDGLIEATFGWNTLDWVAEWPHGNPPDADDGVSGVFNWQFVYTLNLAAQLEDMLGETALAQRQRRLAVELARNLEVFWNEERGIFADDLAHQHYSEHSQVLSILSGQLDAEQVERAAHGLLNTPRLARSSPYFTHYLFETFRLLGLTEAFFQRMETWFHMLEIGMKTPYEKHEDYGTRSDCHGWSSHPLYHFYATILGIRPASLGFQTVDIAPQPGPLMQIHGTLPHPQGAINADFNFEQDNLRGSVMLPAGISGVLRWLGQEIPLQPGENKIGS